MDTVRVKTLITISLRKPSGVQDVRRLRLSIRLPTVICLPVLKFAQSDQRKDNRARMKLANLEVVVVEADRSTLVAIT